VRKYLLLAAVCSLAGGCGSSHTTSSTTTTPATTGAATQTVGVYFFRNGALTEVTEQVAQTTAVAASALAKLLAGPPAGYQTAIPAAAGLSGVAIAGGTATATFRAGLGALSRSAQAQVVATLTRFPTVHDVSIGVEGSGRVILQGGDGTDLGRPATNADYVDLTPDALIFVRTPLRDSTVSSPVRLAGTADTFEATFQLEIHAGGRLLGARTITASSGTGIRGTWSTTLALPVGDVTLVLYEASAKDGSHLHTTEVPLHVR
jgi:Immunoglobulin-like domain of bacterial spore germination/Sporulation and spore germination